LGAYFGLEPHSTYFDSFRYLLRSGFTHAIQWFLIAVSIGFSGALIAWRWILGTGLLFVALVASNEIYLHWLTPVIIPD
jgi:hypothetical protein